MRACVRTKVEIRVKQFTAGFTVSYLKRKLKLLFITCALQVHTRVRTLKRCDVKGLKVVFFLFRLAIIVLFLLVLIALFRKFFQFNGV